MIARVRIAPVEQWKDKHPNLVGKLATGTVVAIDTASMWMDYSDHPEPPFRSWHILGESREMLNSLLPNDAGNSICEHLLEMD